MWTDMDGRLNRQTDNKIQVLSKAHIHEQLKWANTC